MVKKQKLDFGAVILAAGVGKRMKSTLPKVLHSIAGRPMLARTLDLFEEVGPRQTVIVVNPQIVNRVKKAIGNRHIVAVQKSPLGTADAAKAGLLKVFKNIKQVMVVNGDDSAFYKPQTIFEVFSQHQKSKAKITFVTIKLANPSGLGRIVRKKGKLVAIVEEKDATWDQKKIKEVNAGLYFFDKNWLLANLPKLKPSPFTGELYLTDLVALGLKNGEVIETYVLKDPNQWHGINTREELRWANQKFARRIHIMGAAGAGAAAVAGIAQKFGYEATGCDLNPHSAYTTNLKLQIERGHHRRHLVNVGRLVISPAVQKFNPKNWELTAAKKLKIPIFTWQEFQGKFLQKGKFVIAVAGGYGKSTTAAMISQILVETGLDPTCEIGAKVSQWGTNFRVGQSKYYVCEADEYNNNFLNYQPNIAVILNLAWDHPDFFKSPQAVSNSYQKFIDQIKSNGKLVIGKDSALIKLVRTVPKSIQVIPMADFGKINLSIIGDFRKENANAALTVAGILGIDLKRAKKSIESFQGVGRRLEFKGQIGKVKIYDDYAVQPYTVQMTANALKENFPNKRVVLVLEPHTFSRIKTFFNDFVHALKSIKIDRVLITNVFAAREKGDSVKLAKNLALAIGPKACYTGTLTQTAQYLKKHLENFDVICSMGAGEVYKLYDFICKTSIKLKIF